MEPKLISRRDALKTVSCGFGFFAMAALNGLAAARSQGITNSKSSIHFPHFAPRAKRMIFIFMQGGPSQVDTFDYKPLLEKRDGDLMSFQHGASKSDPSVQRIMKSPWEFKPHGESGHLISDLFPAIARHADDLCFIHSMQTEGMAHGPATLFLHSGATTFGRPSIGSWVTYGLGSENENLPGFVTLSPSMSNGGPRNYGSAFLPPIYQGVPIGRAGVPLSESTIPHLTNGLKTRAAQKREFDLIQSLNRAQANERAGDRELEAIIQSYELAWRMQSTSPELLDISGESQATLESYGIGQEHTDAFGRQCLLARRLSEAGVRFVQVTYGDNTANPAWDQHTDITQHATHARAVDQPVAALLQDLKQRGLLDDTLIWWGSEFGRTPFAERNGHGRDHNPQGFTCWLAGAGVRKGHRHGETDEFGHVAVRDPVHMHDLHATLLHLLGLDHEKLTFQHQGRDYRLTDIGGNVVHSILA